MMQTRKTPEILPEEKEPQSGVCGRGQQGPACAAGNIGGCEDVTEPGQGGGHL